MHLHKTKQQKSPLKKNNAATIAANKILKNILLLSPVE